MGVLEEDAFFEWARYPCRDCGSMAALVCGDHHACYIGPIHCLTRSAWAENAVGVCEEQECQSKKVNSATENITTFTCVRNGSHSVKRGECNAVGLAKEG